jgi:hypothetical protein
MLIALIALKSFTFRGINYRTGERFEASPITAAILKRNGSARFATKDDVVRQKRTYRRRDMVAELPDADD